MKKTPSKKKLLHKAIFFVLFLTTFASHSASVEMIWGEESKIPLLQNFQLNQPHDAADKDLQLPEQNLMLASDVADSSYALSFNRGIVDKEQTSHVRYTQRYQGLEVWGYQIIYHLHAEKQTLVTGILLKDIEQDIKSLVPKMKKHDVQHLALAQDASSVSQAEKPKQIINQLIIYLNPETQKAVLAYHTSFFQRNNNKLSQPNTIVDANTGEILKYWDGLPTIESGQGLGGVTINNLPYRAGAYQFGNPTEKALNSLGKFDIKIDAIKNLCTISNSLYRVINLKNKTEEQLPFAFPATIKEEVQFNLVPFFYRCVAPSYINMNDDGFAPINGGYSPINEVAYFLQETFKMYQTVYGLPQPVGNSPIRVYTHVANFDNAFAIPAPKIKPTEPNGRPQQPIEYYHQLVFGNGESYFAPLTGAAIVSHELSHLITAGASDLIYHGQSGAINEAFSDAAAFALNDYLRRKYPWYWNGTDWQLGTDISKFKKPLRYLNNPPLDGRSIDNAAKYFPGMDVHHSSGVFNKAFYLLSNTNGWTVQKAFEVFLAANLNYWVPSTNFSFGACGVINAAKDRGYDTDSVIAAFQQVGVSCSTDEIR